MSALDEYDLAIYPGFYRRPMARWNEDGSCAPMARARGPKGEAFQPLLKQSEIDEDIGHIEHEVRGPPTRRQPPLPRASASEPVTPGRAIGRASRPPPPPRRARDPSSRGGSTAPSAPPRRAWGLIDDSSPLAPPRAAPFPTPRPPARSPPPRDPAPAPADRDREEAEEEEAPAAETEGGVTPEGGSPGGVSGETRARAPSAGLDRARRRSVRIICASPYSRAEKLMIDDRHT